jgi:hypothetical protein
MRDREHAFASEQSVQRGVTKMTISLNGLADTVGSAEAAASSAVNGLGANSTAAELTQASLKMNQYQIVATAVSAIIKADSEAKSAPARSIAK